MLLQIYTRQSWVDNYPHRVVNYVNTAKPLKTPTLVSAPGDSNDAQLSTHGCCLLPDQLWIIEPDAYFYD